MPLPEALLGTRWTEDTARKILPILVWCAENGKKITYGQLDDEVQRRKLGTHVFVSNYGRPAGTVGHAIQEFGTQTGQRIPPINSLLVNAKTGIPGTGCDYFLKRYLAKRSIPTLTVAQRRSMAEDTMEEIWLYSGWRDLLAAFEISPLQGNVPALTDNSEAKKPEMKGGWSSEPESEEHQRLKYWIAKNPEVLKAKIPYKLGKTEWLFSSADRVDVMFEHPEGCLAVEVKSVKSNFADLERGIYQCIKYQALIRAELKASGKIPNGIAVLVIEVTLPHQLSALASLLGIRVVQVPQKRA